VSTSVAPPKTAEKDGTRRQIRGSSLLLVGRFVSKGVNFAVQVLTVRYLAKSDYGAFAYALSVVAIGTTIVTFGLDRAVTRFVPIYHEKRDYNKMFGTLALVLSTILALGVGGVLLFYGLQGVLGGKIIDDEQAVALLLILIFLAPVDALDTVLNGMFAVFSRPTAIFFRKYVLGPLLKLGVVLLLIFSNSSVEFLAAGYLAAGVLAVVIFSVILIRTLREQGLFEHFHLRSLDVPVGAILSFTVPLLTSDLVYIVMGSVDAILLEFFHGTVDVAALRAVQPTAKLNQIVLASFGLLFTPVAARMFARKDTEGINNLYWQNAIWIAVVSFPIFALTFSLAQPLTLLLFGEEYASSAVILALLSFGYYFNAALGQNGLTLKVYGKVRYVMGINIFAAVLNLGLNLFLIPRYGAFGAAVGTFTTLIIFNILKQGGLRLGTNIDLFDWHYVRVYLIITLAAIALLVVQWVTSAPAYVSIALAVIVSFAVFRLNRDALNVEQTFPEILRLPLASWIFGKKKEGV
jgi:O-antigen/teichoic acid export membrane protein